jgi:hypothetical protein
MGEGGEHFTEGFIGEFMGQLNALAKSWELLNGPITRNLSIECGLMLFKFLLFSGRVTLQKS